MAVDAALVIRLGSAILFILLGLFVLVVGRRKRGPLALGTFLVTYAMVTVFTNVRAVLAADTELVFGLYVASLPFVVAASVSGFLAAAWIPDGIPHWKRTVATGLVVGAVAAGLGIFDYSISGDTANVGLSDGVIRLRIGFVGMFGLALAGMLAAATVRMLHQAPSDRRDWLRATAFTVMLAPSLILVWPNRFGSPWSAWTFGSFLVLIAGLTIPLLALASRGSRPAARWALVWPAVGLLTYLYTGLAVNSEAAYNDTYGLNGILRVAGWAYLAYSILRADLLGVKLPHVAFNRGAVAAGSLAVLFIVAQVAQNFFSAEYGLLVGGILAGAFVFAASPIQKAIERSTYEKRPQTDKGQKTTAKKDQESAYRDAVRLALRDRRFEPKEEIALANLADRLGMTAMRATEIRLAVEKERELR